MMGAYTCGLLWLLAAAGACTPRAKASDPSAFVGRFHSVCPRVCGAAHHVEIRNDGRFAIVYFSDNGGAMPMHLGHWQVGADDCLLLVDDPRPDPCRQPRHICCVDPDNCVRPTTVRVCVGASGGIHAMFAAADGPSTALERDHDHTDPVDGALPDLVDDAFKAMLDAPHH